MDAVPAIDPQMPTARHGLFQEGDADERESEAPACRHRV